jgi:hypothetical protein
MTTELEKDMLEMVEMVELKNKFEKTDLETKGLLQEVEELKRQNAVLKKNLVIIEE